VIVDAEFLGLAALVAFGAVVIAVWIIETRGRQLLRLRRTYADMVARVDNVLKAQQQLLADTSHELRTPLTTVRGNLDLLERELPPAERSQVLTETREEVDRMARLVRDLLLLAESGSGELQLEHVPLRLDLLSREVVNRLPGGAQFRFGNAARNTVTGPGIISWDASVHKNFRITEATKLEFRAEAFNLPNHPIFGPPDMSVGGPNYGKITSTAIDSRQLQLALKLIF